MQKQITYPKFIPRVFSMMIDLMILSLVLAPIMDPISRSIFIFMFQEFFTSNSIDISNADAVMAALKSPEFTKYMTAFKFFSYLGVVFIINTFFMGMYFVITWRKWGATPGKILMRMKIVDADDYSKPTTYNLVKRFCWYITAFIGIWSIVFTKKGMAMHDNAANTVVIKS